MTSQHLKGHRGAEKQGLFYLRQNWKEGLD